MLQWTKSEERLNRFAGLLKGNAMTYLIHYWGTVHDLTANAVHKHSFYEICCVLGGKGVYEEEGRIYPLYEGVFFCSRPEVVHQIREVESLDLLFVAFEPDAKRSESEACERFTKALLQGQVWLDSAGQSPTAHLWRSLLLTGEWSRPLSVSLLSPLAHALLDSFAELFGADESPDSAPVSSNAATLIKRARLYIRDNLGSPLSLPEVARYMNVSERQLSRIFAGSIHETFTSFVRLERIRAAEQLLAQTDVPIKEIAERTGFSSVHYFTRVFTRAKGIPPAAFRQARR